MEVLSEPQNWSPMRPPQSMEQKQQLPRATRSHLPPLPEPTESSSKSELPGRRTAPRRGTAPAERAGGGRVSAPRAAEPGEACLYQSPKGWAAAARRRLCSLGVGGGGMSSTGCGGGGVADMTRVGWEVRPPDHTALTSAPSDQGLSGSGAEAQGDQKLYVIFSYTRDPPAVQMVSITRGKKPFCWYAGKAGAGKVWEKLPVQPACLQTNPSTLSVLLALGPGALRNRKDIKRSYPGYCSQ